MDSDHEELKMKSAWLKSQYSQCSLVCFGIVVLVVSVVLAQPFHGPDGDGGAVGHACTK